MAKKKEAPTVIRRDGLAISQANLNALALGYDFENRAIYLFGAIDEMSAYRFIAGFKYLDRTPGPIHILLNSPGGSVGNGLAIYDTLRTANNPTLIEGMGDIASAAVPILLAGTVRFLNPNTDVMIHNMSADIDGGLSTTDIHSLSRSAERINQRYAEIIAARTGRSINDVKKWMDNETSFSCEEAIKYGFADKLLDQRSLPKNFEDGLAEINGRKEAIFENPPIQEPPKKTKKKR